MNPSIAECMHLVIKVFGGVGTFFQKGSDKKEKK
jgi:hypothetical protein